MKKLSLFTQNDLRRIKKLGLTPRDVEKQMDLYRHGSNYLDLNRPCAINDGILSIQKAEMDELIKLYEREAGKFRLLKFVPASGAASRMFAEWFSALEKDGFASPALNKSFLRNLKKYPFYSLIKKNKRASQLIEKKNIKGLLDYILSANGLNFGWLPKALIPFHQYRAGDARTPLEEHLFEAVQYVRSAGDVCHLHFTISQEHKKDVAKKIKTVKSKYENFCRIKYIISSSVQSPSTNMLAVDENNLPLRDAEGNLIFRPGGHGSLLTNLQNLDADFIFIKNIDNIVPEKLLRKTLPYKKMLGGLALKIQQKIFATLRQMENDEIDSKQIDEIKNYCSRINIIFPRSITRQSLKQQKQNIFSSLNRPLRVCAIVRNEGEPGGAPFWVDERDGNQTLQIVESGHVDKSSPKQMAVWSAAQYFNPVDLVCCMKNYRGEKFNLDSYVNRDAYLITMKNEKGRSLKALESPGLWNGGMAYWNTIFVELPIIVFNPVKTVNDLLRPEHITKS
jgi:ribosomal protein S18